MKKLIEPGTYSHVMSKMKILKSKWAKCLQTIVNENFMYDSEAVSLSQLPCM